MKIEVTLSKKEAQEIIGAAITKGCVGSLAQGLEVDSIEWTSYGGRVEITLTAPEVIEPVANTAAA